MWRLTPTSQPCCGDSIRQANHAVRTHSDTLSSAPTAQTFCGEPWSDSPHAVEPRAPTALPCSVPCCGNPTLQQPKHAFPCSDSQNMLRDPRSDSPMLWSLMLLQPLHTVELRAPSALPCCGALRSDSPSMLWRPALQPPFHDVETRSPTTLPRCGDPISNCPSTLWSPELR
ncbi:hypothetical protein XELAEV_18000545mg [Xenopus laevis]|nr:hypothetical protein XELAEV_18000545mg [Xenopus laevis]